MEKNTIIQWLNTLTKSHKVSNLHELKDGKHFLEFARTINPVKKLTFEREGNVNARYEFVKETLEDYFHFEFEKSIDLQGCIKGKEKELVRLACLLLSAVINHCLSDENFLNPLIQLDIKIQEQIKNCLQLILLSDNEVQLRSNILSINSIEETPRTQYTRLRSSLEGAAASPALKKRGGRKRTASVESPLKLFIDSPTLKHQAVVRKMSKEVSELRQQLNAQESKALEFETQNFSMKAELSKKDKEITELKENVKSLRPYRDLAEESHENKLELEEKLEQLKNIYQNCPACKDLEERSKNLEKELNEERENHYSKDEKITDINQRLEKNFADLIKKELEITALKENVKELENKMRALSTKEENMQFEISIYRNKYEEIVKNQRSPSTPKRSPGESVKGIIDIERQKQKEKIQELEKEIEQLKITKENVLKELTESKKEKINKEKKHFEEVNHLTTRYGVLVENQEKLELENTELKNQLMNKENEEKEREKLSETNLEKLKLENMELKNQLLNKEIEGKKLEELSEKDLKKLELENTELKNQLLSKEIKEKECEELSKKNLEKLELENTELKNQLLNQEIKEKEHEQLSGKIHEYEKAVDEYILQIQNLEKEIAHSTTRFSMVEKEVEERNAEVLHLRNENFSLSEKLKICNDQLLEQQNEHTMLSQENLELKCEMQTLAQETEKKNEWIIELQQQNDCLQSQNSSLESELQQLSANNRFLEGEIDRLKQRMQAKCTELMQAKEENVSFLQKEEKSKIELQSQMEKIKDLQKKIGNNLSEIKKHSAAYDQKDTELKKMIEVHADLSAKYQKQKKILFALSETNKTLALKLENEERKYAEMKNECEYTGSVKNKEINKLKRSKSECNADMGKLDISEAQTSSSSKILKTTTNTAFSGHVSELNNLQKEFQNSDEERENLKQKNEALDVALKINSAELKKVNAEVAEIREKLTVAESNIRVAESTLQNLQSAHNKHFAICSGQCDDDIEKKVNFEKLERERNHLVDKIEQLKAALSSVVEKKNNLKKEREELQKLKVLHSMHFSTCSGDCNDFEMEKKNTFHSLEVENTILLEKISKMTREINLKEQELETKNKIINEASVALEQKETELQVLHRTMEEKQKFCEELNAINHQLQQKAVELEEFQRTTLKKTEKDHNVEKEKEKYENIRNLSDCLENTQNQLAQSQSENRDMQKKIRDLTFEIEEYSKEIRNTNGENETLKSELKELRIMYEDNIKKLEEMDTKNKEIAASLKHNEEKLRTAASDSEKCHMEIHSLQKEKDEYEESLSSLSSILENTQNQLTVCKTENNALRKEVQDLTFEVEEFKNKMVHLNEENEIFKSEIQELRIMYEDNVRKIEEMDSENKEIRASRNLKEEELRIALTDVKTWRAEFEQLQKSHVKHLGACTDCTNSEHAESSEFTSLRATVHLQFKDKEWYDKRFVFDSKLLEVLDERNNFIQRLEDHIHKLETKEGEIPCEQHPMYEKLLKANESLCSQKEMFEAELQESRKRLRDVNTEMKAVAEKLKKLERTSQYNETRLSAKYEKAKEVIEKIRTENSQYERKLKDALGQIKLYEQRVFDEEKYEQALKESKEEYAALKEDLEDMQHTVNPLRIRINTLENDLKEANDKLILAGDQYKLARNELKKLRKSTEKRTGPNTPSFLSQFITPKRRKPQDAKGGSEKKKKKGPVTYNNVFYKMDVDDAVYYSIPVTPGVTMSLDGSTSKNMSKSRLGGASHFKCDDEEEFLNHSSLLSSKNTHSPSVKKPAAQRQMELSRRNTLCLPHLRSTYPLELQTQTPPPLGCPTGFKMAKPGKKNKHDIPDFELDKPVKGVFYEEFGDLYKMVPSNRYKIHSEEYPVTVKEYNEIQRKIDAIEWRPFPMRLFDKKKDKDKKSA